jgi:hypothetical protein
VTATPATTAPWGPTVSGRRPTAHRPTTDAGDADDDNDGIGDATDPDDANPNVCGDSDGDTCDDCSVGSDGFGPASDSAPADDGTDTDGDGACDAGDTDDDNDGVADGSDPASLNPDICGDGDFDGCEDCLVGTDDFGPLPDSSPFNDGPDTDADGLCDAGDGDDDNDGVADGSDPDLLNPDVCGDSDGDTCDDCSIGTDDLGPLADVDPFNDGPDADADGICDAGEATLTVIKQVTNDNGGTLDPHDFTLETTGTAVATGTLSFRGDAAGTVIDLDPGAYDVTENPKYDGFYGASFSTDCTGEIAPGDAKTCTITNDDIVREQTSSRVDSVNAALSDSAEGSRDVISGEFVMSDQSSGPQALTLLLSDYEIDFQYKKRKSFEASDPVNDSFNVNGQTVYYACEYSILAHDVPGATDGFESGDPVEFDESITVGYSCRLCTTVVAGECAGSESLPNVGTLKVTAGAMVFGRPDFTYTLSPTFKVTSGGLD